MRIDYIFRCWLNTFVTKHRCQFSNILRNRSENSFILKWIFEKTSELNDIPNRTLGQRIHWILFRISGWDDNRVCCRKCGKQLRELKSFRSLGIGYKEYCSLSCSGSGNADIAKKTRIAKNGGKYLSDKSLEKSRQTCFRKYGATNNMQSQIGLAEYKKSLKKKYGVENQFQRKRIKLKSENTKRRKYGDSKYNNSDKAISTIKQLQADDPNYWEKRTDKKRQTCIERYGVDHPMKIDEIKVKSHQNRHRTSRYMFNGDCFVTIPELAFAIYCVEHKIQYIYEDEKSIINYIDGNGKRHKYFPDFHIVKYGNKTADFLVEIKGDNHFKDRDPSTGKLIAFEGPKYDHIQQAKYDAMIANRVVLVTTKRYAKYLKYAKKKYGRKFHLKYKADWCK